MESLLGFVQPRTDRRAPLGMPFGCRAGLHRRCSPAREGGPVLKGIVQGHHFDEDNRPAGGYTRGAGINIQWQNGPLVHHGERHEPNGAFAEDVIAAVIGRIEFYQRSRYHCIENAVALGHLRGALEVLEERKRARADRGVEVTISS